MPTDASLLDELFALLEVPSLSIIIKVIIVEAIREATDNLEGDEVIAHVCSPCDDPVVGSANSQVIYFGDYD
jgi:hypothetical protein